MIIDKSICYLHIGTEKTGTTSLQNLFFKNKNKLLQAGILYPEFNNSSNHFDLVKNFCNKSRLKENLEFYHSSLSELQDEILDQIKYTRCHKVLFSSEHFHSLLIEKSEIQNLKIFLSNFFSDFKIIVYLKPQDLLLKGLYSTHVSGGGSLSIKDLLNDDLYFNYKIILNRWASVFGESSLIVRPFIIKDVDWLFQDFFSCLELDVSLLNHFFIDPLRDNVSLSASALVKLRLFNIELNKRGIFLDSSDRKIITEISRLSWLDDFDLITDDIYDLIYARYESDNLLIAEKYSFPPEWKFKFNINQFKNENILTDNLFELDLLYKFVSINALNKNISRIFKMVFDREIDPEGLKYWSNQCALNKYTSNELYDIFKHELLNGKV